MPILPLDVLEPEPMPLAIALEPAFNAYHSLFLIAKSEDYSGLDPWITSTAAALTPEEFFTHRLVLIGFHYAAIPDQWGYSFPAYLHQLKRADPQRLVARMRDAYLQHAHMPVPENGRLPTWEEALEGPDAYLEFLSSRFPPESVIPDIERVAYEYVIKPAELQSLIASHLEKMWSTYLKDEWERRLPTLEKVVRAWQKYDFGKMGKLEAARIITDHDLQADVHWRSVIQSSNQLLFIPNPHAGPYLGKFQLGKSTAIFFGARMPAGAEEEIPELSRADILIRLGALADDNRLRILKYISEHGEQRAQDLIDSLGLSQSAVSRHISQLSATGYVVERRCDGAKCYHLNAERINEILEAVRFYLLGQPSL